MNPQNQEPSLIDTIFRYISLVDITLLVIFFLFFNAYIVAVHSIPDRMFLIWHPTSGNPVVMLKELGIFFIPAIVLTIFLITTFGFLWSTTPDRKLQWRVLKIISTLILTILYAISFLKNTTLPGIQLHHILIGSFGILAIVIGGLHTHYLIQHKLHTTKQLQHAFPLIESILTLILGILILNGLFFNDYLKALTLIVFLSAFGYGILYVYELIIHIISDRKKLNTYLQNLEKTPPLLPDIPEKNTTSASNNPDYSLSNIHNS